MKKQQIRDYIKGLFGGHIEFVEKVEQHKEAKIEMEDKVNRMLELLKDDGFEGKETLAKLIQDLHKQYQILYADYDRLTGVLKEDDSEYYTLLEQYKQHRDETLAKINELADKVTELESTRESLQGQKRERGSEFMSKETKPAEQMGELVEGSRNKILEPDQLNTETWDHRDQFFTCQDTEEQREMFYSLTGPSLETLVVAQKNEMGLQYDEEKQKLLDDLMQLRKIELTSMTADLQGKLDELNSKLIDVHKQLDDKCQEHKISMAESKYRIIADLEQNYRTAELKYQEDQKVLEDRIAALSGIISTTREDYESSIRVLSNQLDEWGREVLQTRERVENLATKASKEQKEKSGLIKAVNELEKMLDGLKLIVEKENEAILDLVTKKRDAIRQL